MTRAEFVDAVEDIGARLEPPITVDDCGEIYKELKPQLDAGTTLDVVLRPKHIEVIANGMTADVQTVTIAVRS